MKTCSNSSWKGKRTGSISMAHMEGIGELEGKKSLFEEIPLFSKLRRSGKNPATFV